MMLLIFILVILTCLYAYKAYNINTKAYNTEYQILQLKPAQLTEAILDERNPIIVETSEMMDDVLKSEVLRNKYKQIDKVRSNIRVGNNARLKAISYNKSDKAMVEIFTPKHAKLDKDDPEYQSMTIVLRKGHVLLLPFMWHFSSDHDLTTVDIHDWFSRIYSYMM